MPAKAAAQECFRQPLVFLLGQANGAFRMSAPIGPSSRCRSTRPSTRSSASCSTRSSRRGRWRCSRSRSPTLVNDLIDGFIDRGEVDFAAEFSIPFPSQVFLTLLGLPLDELPGFLAMKDGIIRPDHVTGQAVGHDETHAHQEAIGAVDLRRTSTRCSTSGRRSGGTTC